MYDASHFTSGDGTSFSTPMVAGAAAGIIAVVSDPDGRTSQVRARQYREPDGYDRRNNPRNRDADRSGPAQHGKCRHRRRHFLPGQPELRRTVLLGQHNHHAAPHDHQHTLASTDQYALSLKPLVAGPSVSLSTTNTGPVPSNQSVTINVTIQAAAPLTGGFQGYISVQSAQTSMIYSVPYWAGIYVPDSNRVLRVSQSATGQNVFSNLRDALAAANPGNVIEIADTQTYTLPTPSDPNSAPEHHDQHQRARTSLAWNHDPRRRGTKSDS